MDLVVRKATNNATTQKKKHYLLYKQDYIVRCSPRGKTALRRVVVAAARL